MPLLVLLRSSPGATQVYVCLTYQSPAHHHSLQANSRSCQDFIEAADSLGFTRRFIIVRHVLPNALSPLLAHAALRFGHKLITVGALSFLGLGVQPPASDWGRCWPTVSRT
ncbi:ABC transporter permease subunit [Georgenia sp. SUBG003]|uniref:ABC transporter permease subunit n=1 Tax=Georgenia sp. SUBG003 TaxID=1497974 RepID=UPI003AB5DC81